MLKKFITLAVVAIGAMTATAQAQPKDDGIVSIGWTTWADAEAVSKLATIIIGQGMKTHSELTLSDINIQYRNIAEGNLDIMMMAWLPGTHSTYMKKYGDDLVDMGALYENARIGWVIPDYIPEDQVRTPSDLKAHAAKFEKRIIGIDEGAGLTRLTRGLVDKTGIKDWKLEIGTGPLMAKKVGDAYSENKWFVATAWNPHWIFSKYKLRYIEDPDLHFGEPDSVHILTRKGFAEDYPKVAAFLSRFRMTMPQVEGLISDAQTVGHRKAAYKFINENKDLVSYWIHGKK